MTTLVNDLTLGDRLILSRLPLVGDSIGGHALKKPVRALIEDLGFEFTSGELNGRLRSLAFLDLAVLVDGDNKRQAGWQVTLLGRAAVEQFDLLLVTRALTAGRTKGDGLAEIVAVPEGPVVGYVVTPERYQRMSDDPVLGRTRIEPVALPTAVTA